MGGGRREGRGGKQDLRQKSQWRKSEEEGCRGGEEKNEDNGQRKRETMLWRHPPIARISRHICSLSI